MGSAFLEAINLIFSGDRILFQIIGVTMRMTLISSLIAMVIGVPVGVWLGSATFRGKKVLIVIVRAFS